MKQLYREYHWFRRFLASDPGLIRFDKAGRATISLMLSIFTTLFILQGSENAMLPAIVSGMSGMMGIMIVLDDTRRKQQLTTLLLGISAMLGVTLGSLFAGNIFYIDLLLILFVFSSFYFTRFGVRYFSLSMIGFMTVYISSVLNLPSNQLLWFYMSISIGIAYAFLVHFVLFQATAKNLKRSVQSFHFQSNFTFNLLIKGMKETELNPNEKKVLQKNVHKLKQYATIVTGYIQDSDVQELWPGLTPAQLRLYVFDTGMLIETLADSIESLRTANAFEIDELRRLLIWVIESLRDTDVLAQHTQDQNLEEAELAVQALRMVIMDLFNQDEQPKGWLFLIRRIESITNHVIEGAMTIQQSLLHDSEVKQQVEETDEETELEDSGEEEPKEKEDKKEKGLKPSTKKAYQALVAGGLSIVVGQIISPSQPYWVLLTAYIVLLGTESVGRIYTKGFQRSLGTIIGAVVGFALASLLTGRTVLEVILIFIVLFLSFYVMNVSYTMMNVFITMMIAFMYDFLLGGITLSLIGARVLDTIAGAVIAFSVSMVIFPKKTEEKVAESTKEYLNELKPYVTEYVRGFREDVNVKELSEGGLKLEQKLQTIKDEAHSLIQRPGSPNYASMTRWITVFTALNYYAKHLVASSYRKGFDYPDELINVFKQMEEKLDQNIDSLIKLIEGTDQNGIIESLDSEREQIERLAPTREQSQRDLIHHLYYIWRINQSIVEFGMELGSGKK